MGCCSKEELEEFGWMLRVPSSLTDALIKEAHDVENRAHGDIHKTLTHLRTKYYWPNMIVYVKNYVRNCIICKESKSCLHIYSCGPFDQICISQGNERGYVYQRD